MGGMLRISSEDLGGALAVLDVGGDPEDPKWILDEDGRARAATGTRRVFLASFKIAVHAAVRDGRRFRDVDEAQDKLLESSRDAVAEVLARLVEAAAVGGDFKVLVHSRDWRVVPETRRVTMETRLSAALCGNFMGRGPDGPESGNWPSPKRIFGKISDHEVAVEVSREMLVESVMDD